MKPGTALSLALLLLIAGAVGFFFHGQYARQMELRRLREEVARLLSEERYARLYALPRPAGSGRTSFRWASTDAEGRPLEGSEVRELAVDGDEVFIDTYQIVFDGDRVREGDPLRGRTLTLFFRAFGDHQRPVDGEALEVPPELVRGRRPGEEVPLVPPAFRAAGSGSAREFQARLWREFWRMAGDPKAAASAGVRCAQGTAVHKRLVPDREYVLTLTRQGQILFDGPFEPGPFVRPDR